MASAVATIMSLGGSNGRVAAGLAVVFSGTDVPDGPQDAQLSYEFDGTTAATVIRTGLSTAISNLALERGFTVTGANMLLPAFQKG